MNDVLTKFNAFYLPAM